MSAICGILNLNGDEIQGEISASIMEKLSQYKVDKLGTWNNKGIFLGSAVQHITLESKLEKLPYYDELEELVITADAIIDNRRELFSLMNIPQLEWSNIPDSQLILRAYKKWGEECPKYLIGDFAFAIWNDKTREIFCARDHVGNRAFYFYCSSNIFAFCTLSKPLLCVCEKGAKLNDEWIANFLSLKGPIHEVDSNQTVYADINQLLPAYTIKLSDKGMIKEQYWDPLSLPELRFKTDVEYEQEFRKVFFEAVNCRLRSMGSVGIMMSGGLDSGSVACIAAQKLEVIGKRLKAFSAIPFSDYKDWLPKNVVTNESEFIEVIREQFKNIDIEYCSSEGKNSVTNIEEYIDFLEQPYKFAKNFFWVNEIANAAVKEGCTVLLDGQYGNFTVSFGDLPTHLITLFRRGKWLSLEREIRAYSKFRNCKRVDVNKEFLKIILPDNIKGIYNRIRGRKKNNEKNNIWKLVNPKLSLKYKVDERFRKNCIGPYSKINSDLAEVRKAFVSPIYFSQVGAVDTKTSLKYGLQKRDPTRDKRVIEFCLRLPSEQYVQNGHERSLIRRSMAGVLPDKVRLNYDITGTQSADWIQRLLPIWQQIKTELENMMKKEKFKSYIDVAEVEKALQDIGDYPEQNISADMNMVIISLIFGRFINKFEARI
ncbi:asparagine synthase-related protein [Clostridium sp.]|uniref:asparagine synthase-related protein n=1 Tax=Clostridium sp. TaxID=1506 RepID=UPI003D6D8D73